MSHATLWRTKLRDALLTARKDRDSTRVAALRSALSAIDNAGAVPTATSGTVTPVDMNLDAPSSGAIANAVVGLGAAALRGEAQVLAEFLGDV